MGLPRSKAGAWQGHFALGEGWAAYRGPTDQNSPHAHVALQLAVGLGSDLEVSVEGATLRAPGILVRPLATHGVATGLERVAFFYIEPQARLGQALLQLCRTQPAVALPDHLIACVEEDPARTVSTLERALGVASRRELDPRLARALALLAEADGRSGRVGRAAAEAGLSESRLRRLAREELGTPLARWSLWQKLSRSARALAGGASLVEAAAEGSFSDQAHLARTMRRMFGVTPSTAAGAVRSRPEAAQE